MKAFKDAFNLLCGSKLGGGIYRDVFECLMRPDLVVKVELETNYGRSFANVFEYRFWDNNQYYSKVANWLAPCIKLSGDGYILLQKRVEPLPESFELPKKMPSFLTDFKRSNFGLLAGKLVCVDYMTTIDNAQIQLKVTEWD